MLVKNTTIFSKYNNLFIITHLEYPRQFGLGNTAPHWAENLSVEQFCALARAVDEQAKNRPALTLTPATAGRRPCGVSQGRGRACPALEGL